MVNMPTHRRRSYVSLRALCQFIILDKGVKGFLTPNIIMFRYAADRIPVLFVVMFSMIDFIVYFLVDGVGWLAGFTMIMIIPKAVICAWNHHHQHTMTFHAKALNRILEFFYALHSGVTTNLWLLHHVLGHHRNFLDHMRDESGWKRVDGKRMRALEYTLKIAATAYYRGYQVGKKYPRAQRDFLVYSVLTLIGVAVLCWFRFVPALFVFVLPMIISLLFTAWVTFDHHSGLDTDDAFHASYNNVNPLYNFLTGNLGYHTAHHYRQGLHWSKLPELHEKIRHRIPSKLIRNAQFVLAEA
jgi:fatty acid desaturase